MQPRLIYTLTYMYMRIIYVYIYMYKYIYVYIYIHIACDCHISVSPRFLSNVNNKYNLARYKRARATRNKRYGRLC